MINEMGMILCRIVFFCLSIVSPEPPSKELANAKIIYIINWVHSSSELEFPYEFCILLMETTIYAQYDYSAM